MNRVGVLLVVLLASAGVLWLLFAVDDSRDGGASTANESTVGEATQPAPGAGLSSTGVQAPPVAADAANAPPADPRTAVTVTVRGADGSVASRALICVRPDHGGGPAPDRRTIGTWWVDSPGTLKAFPSAVWLEVFQAVGADGARLPLASHLVGPFAADTRSVEIELPKELSIAGRVLDANGRAVGGVRIVALFDRGRGRRWQKHGEAVSADDGTFRFGWLRAGTYHLESWPKGAHGAAETLAVEAGAEAVIVQLKPGIIAELTIVDADGKPMQGVHVRGGVNLAHGKGFVTSADAARDQTDANGRVRLEALDSTRTYLLELKAYGRKDVVPYTDWNWKPVSTTIQMVRAMEVRGRCQFEDGRPFPHASVSVDPVGKKLFLSDGRAKQDGTFVVGKVPDGPVRVRARRRDQDGMVWKSERVESVAGATDVVLVMKQDPVGTIVVKVEGWPEGAGDEGRAFLTAEPDGKLPEHATVPGVVVGSDGTARFERRRLLPRYTFFVATPDGKRCAYVNHIQPGKAPAVVNLQAAFTIRGRLEVPEGAEGVSVYAHGGGIVSGGRLGEHGDYEIRGLPAGTWKVGASAKLPDRFILKKSEVDAGATLDIELE